MRRTRRSELEPEEEEEGKERVERNECEAGGGKEGEGLYSSLDTGREGGVRQLLNLSFQLSKMRRIALGVSLDRRPRAAVFGILERQQESLFRLQQSIAGPRVDHRFNSLCVLDSTYAQLLGLSGSIFTWASPARLRRKGR